MDQHSVHCICYASMHKTVFLLTQHESLRVYRTSHKSTEQKQSIEQKQLFFEKLFFLIMVDEKSL